MARKSIEEIKEVRDLLRSMVESGEILKYTEEDLEKKLNWTRKTIRKHLREIKKDIGHRDIKIISIKFIDIMEETIKDVEALWRKAKEEGNDVLIMKYCEKMWQAIDRFTDFMERFGIKEKVVDKVEIDAKSTNIQINYFNQNNIINAFEESLGDKLDEKSKQQVVLSMIEKSKQNEAQN